MIKAIIVDDELKGAKTLQMLIDKYCTGVEITGLYDGVASAKEAIKKHEPQLVFLDIEMPFENGFHLIEQTKDYAFEIIFTTAYMQYAINAIKTNALDYLLKPIDIEELIAAVNKAVKKIEAGEFSNVKNIETMFDGFLEKRNRKIALPALDSILLVSPEEIVSFEADSNYTHVNLSNSKKVTVSKTLKVYEKSIEGMSFMRVHHSYIINFIHIEKYIKGDGGTLVMKTGIQVPVSRVYKNELLRKIGMY